MLQLQGTYFILAESMPCNYGKIVFLILTSVWMNTFCHTVCCMYVQLNRQCCETHGMVII